MLRSKVLLTIIILILGVAPLQADDIYAVVDGNVATIWHRESNRNCGSLYQMDVSLTDNLITVTEVDTGQLAYCLCWFDLAVTVGPLEPGDYTVEIYSDEFDETHPYWGSTQFTIDGVGLLDQTNSGCVGTREDTTFVEIEVDDDTMTLTWGTPLINCCLEPDWAGWLTGDTLHVTMTDIGPPCDCICPFVLTASFGPFPPGTYVLDFGYGNYGYPTFTIPRGGQDGELVLDSFQSDCYGMQGIEDDGTISTSFHRQNYPNPFNPTTTISFTIPSVGALLAAPNGTRQAVSLRIFNPTGQLIETLINDQLSPGEHSVVWNAHDQPSGMYFYRLQAGDYVETKKLMLLK